MPVMEINDVVSVRDGAYPSLAPVHAYLTCCGMIEEAFAAKHLPDMGYDVKDFKVFNWKLSSWKKLDKKLTSPDFECGGHKWCVI